jgi:hypothetical protein
MPWKPADKYHKWDWRHKRNGDEESEWWKFEPRKHRKHIVKEGIKEKA